MYKYKDRVIVARSMLLLNYTLAIRLYMTRYNDCPKEHVRLFVSTVSSVCYYKKFKYNSGWRLQMFCPKFVYLRT